jgi:lipoate-protein ligase B
MVRKAKRAVPQAAVAPRRLSGGGAGNAAGWSVEWLGLVPYPEALELQEKRVEALRHGSGPECLLLLEHPPVITLGRSGNLEHVLAPAAALEASGIPVHRVSRGGDVTFHGPGQLVGYLVLDLARRGEPDVGRFLRLLEATLIEALAELGLEAHVRPGMTGVFAGPAPAAGPEYGHPRKIASIGVGLRGWITWHGFALNVTTDLAAFGAIVPCGLRDVEMTSVEAELGDGAPQDLDARVRDAVTQAVLHRFGRH